jgi:hypothetical protein
VKKNKNGSLSNIISSKMLPRLRPLTKAKWFLPGLSLASLVLLLVAISFSTYSQPGAGESGNSANQDGQSQDGQSQDEESGNSANQDGQPQDAQAGSAARPPVQSAALVLSKTSFTPGESIRVSGRGYLVGSRVSITIYSEPRFLGTYTVNNQGEFLANVIVPMDLEEGEHTLVAEGFGENGDALKTSVGVSYDRTAPSIKSVTPTSGSFTVGDTLTITVVANDSSGVKNMYVLFFDVTGGGQVQRDFCGTPYFLTRTSGSGAGTQTWSKTCVVPPGVISGDYEIRPVAEDIFGNYNMAGTVMAKGNMSIVGGVSDRTAPSIDSVTPTSGSFTVGDTLTITVVANDSSGIKNMFVRFFDVTGGGQVQRDFCGTPYFLTRTSGSGAGTQTWSKTCVVPDGVISGDYEIRPVAEDIFGNYNMAGTVMTNGNFRITED